MSNYDAIEEARERLEQAELAAADMDKMVQRIGDYAIVDDGNDKWVADEDSFTDAMESMIRRVLDGTLWVKDEDTQTFLVDCYQAVCDACEVIYSRIGEPSDVANLIRHIGNCDELPEVLAALSLDDQDGVAMIALALRREGGMFTGNCLGDTAERWDDTLDPDTAIAWIDAGFWDPDVADSLNAYWVFPEDAVSAIESQGRTVYDACNGDMDLGMILPAQ